jgi:hypothetical protein
LRSPHAHARIDGIDTSQALAAPGVLAVLTASDVAADGLNALPPSVTANVQTGAPFAFVPQPLLAHGKVRHVGDAYAAVIAETYEQASDAAQRHHAERDYIRPTQESRPLGDRSVGNAQSEFLVVDDPAVSAALRRRRPSKFRLVERERAAAAGTPTGEAFAQVAGGDDRDVRTRPARQAQVIQGTLAQEQRSSRSSPVVETVLLTDLVDRSVEMIPPALRDSLRIELDASLAAAEALRLPRLTLQQVCQNLIQNAAEAVRQAEFRLAQAEVKLARNRTLAEAGSVSRSDLDDAQQVLATQGRLRALLSATRAVADIILMKDSFAALAPAVSEGQRIVNGMQDILRLYLTRILSMALLIVSSLVIGEFPLALRNGSAELLRIFKPPSVPRRCEPRTGWEAEPSANFAAIPSSTRPRWQNRCGSDGASSLS